MAPIFGALNLDAAMHDWSLALALEWLKHRDVETVADLHQLPADALKELVDGLGLPPNKALRLRASLERELSFLNTGPRDANAANAGDDGETSSTSLRNR